MAARKTILVRNLQDRFPDASEDDINDALLKCNFHGGKATSLLAKSFKLHPAGARPRRAVLATREEEAKAAMLAVASTMLEPYGDLAMKPVVSTQAFGELRELLHDLDEGTITVALLRSGGDVDGAKTWLWEPDAGKGFRREHAEDLRSWAHIGNADLAVYSMGQWSQQKLVLSRKDQNYAYMEEVQSQYPDLEHPDRMSRGVSRTSHAGGKWALEANSDGFVLAASGKATVSTLDPRSGSRLGTKSEAHSLMFFLDRPPWEGLIKPPPEPTKADRIKRRFREIDRNKDGKLEYKELKLLLNSGPVELTDREVTALFNHIDRDHSGFIDFDEFVDYLYPEEMQNNSIYGSWYDDNDFRGILTDGMQTKYQVRTRGLSAVEEKSVLSSVDEKSEDD